MRKWAFVIQGLLSYVAGILYIVDGQRIAGLLCLLMGIVCNIGLSLEEK